MSADEKRARRLRVIGLGASTGGPKALARITSGLPRDFSLPVLVVQHMDAVFHEDFVGWLGRSSALPVRRAVDGELLTPGEVRVGPPGWDLTLDFKGRLRLGRPPDGARFSPSVDALMGSLASHFGAAACGGVLTGMGNDGVVGLAALRRRGGLTFAQNRDSSAIYGMPRACVEAGAAEWVLDLNDISVFLVAAESRYPQSDASRYDFQRTAHIGEARMTKGKILIVDDSRVMLEAGRIALEDAGFDVVTLDNPLALAAMMRKEKPRLVLCDVNMPVINGDLVTEIVGRSGVGESSIILYSDIPTAELEAKAKSCGARGFIQKTGDDEALVRAIEGFLEIPRSVE